MLDFVLYVLKLKIKNCHEIQNLTQPTQKWFFATESVIWNKTGEHDAPESHEKVTGLVFNKLAISKNAVDNNIIIKESQHRAIIMKTKRILDFWVRTSSIKFCYALFRPNT